MPDLLVKLQEITDEEFATLKRRTIFIAHNNDYLLGCWWYEIGTGRFEMLKGKTSHTDPESKMLTTSTKPLLRGRVINYKGKIVCVVYLDPSASPIAKVSESLAMDIKQRCEESLDVVLDYMLSDSGEVLLEKRVIDMINLELKGLNCSI
jgi:hypothetical protein